MKSSRFIGALCAVLLATPAAWAKKKPADFSLLKGNYTGTVVLSDNGAVAASGTSTISFRVPKSGKTAVATVNGALVYPGGTVYSLAATFNFTATAFTLDDVNLHLDGSTTAPDTAPSTLKSTRRFATISGAGPFIYHATSNTIQCLAEVTPKGKNRKQLIFTYTLSGSGITNSYLFVVTAKVRK